MGERDNDYNNDNQFVFSASSVKLIEYQAKKLLATFANWHQYTLSTYIVLHNLQAGPKKKICTFGSQIGITFFPMGSRSKTASR